MVQPAGLTALVAAFAVSQAYGCLLRPEKRTLIGNRIEDRNRCKTDVQLTLAVGVAKVVKSSRLLEQKPILQASYHWRCRSLAFLVFE